jgi:hypothetical protein
VFGFLLEFYVDLKKIILFRFGVNVAACEGWDTDYADPAGADLKGFCCLRGMGRG